HRSARARTPRVAQTSVYSCIAAAAARGIAPSEFEIRYVVVSRIGNSARYRSSGSITGAFYSAVERRTTRVRLQPDATSVVTKGPAKAGRHDCRNVRGVRL